MEYLDTFVPPQPVTLQQMKDKIHNAINALTPTYINRTCMAFKKWTEKCGLPDHLT